MKIFIIAGEESGDQLGAAVLQSLKGQCDHLDIRGIGGKHIIKAGLKESFFAMEDLSLMGIAEILPKVPLMIKRIRQTVDAVKVFNPDIVLSVDCPEFSLRVQEKLSATKCRAKRIHMVAPSVWAWREKRAERISKFLDGLMCLLPFEPPYFEKEGLKSIFIGHTMLGSGLLNASGTAYRFKNQIGLDQKVLGLFFGSRRSEIEKNSELILDVACEMKHRNPDIFFLVPTIDRWKEFLEEKLKERFLNGSVVSNSAEKWDSFAACDAAIAVSGTVALELAILGVPHVITYRANPVTWQIMRRIIKTKFAHLANILLNREVVPEFLQDRAKMENIAPVLADLLNLTEIRESQVINLHEVKNFLQPPDTKNPADVAAGFLISYLQK